MTGYSDTYYQQYIEAARTHWWFRGRERILQRVLLPLVRLPAGRIVLDIGSGPGGPARAVFPKAWIAALDRSLSVLQVCGGANATVVADAHHLPIRLGRVAAVCAFDVLEHLDDDLEALQQWQQVLAPDGWLLITVPAYQALWSRHDEVNRHRRRYRAGAFKELLTAAGFTVVRLTYFNTLLLPGVALVRWIQRLLGAGGNGTHGDNPAEHGALDCQQRLPRWLERCCEAALQIEATWLRGRTLPVGVSICAVARAGPTL